MALLTIEDLLNNDPQEVSELMARAMGLSKCYETFLQEEPKDGDYRSPGLHASEISGCERKPVYSLLNTPRRDQAEPIWRRRFKAGHSIHDMFQRDFRRMAGREDLQIDFEDEVEIDPTKGMYYASKWDIYSHCDGLFTIKDANGEPLIRVVLEIKTKAPDDYEKMQKPEEGHVEQAHVYMACLNAPLTWFLYYNKGNQNYTGSDHPGFFLPFDTKLWATMEERFERMHTAAALNQLPERKEGILCEFCPFSWTCQPNFLQYRKGIHVVKEKWAGQ